MRSKTKLTKDRFGKEGLFKICLDFLLEPNNVRICYVYETHEVEFIMLRRCLLDFTARILRSVMLNILTKSSIKHYFLDISLLKYYMYQAWESSLCR